MATSVLRRTLSQVLMVGVPGPTIDPATKAFLTEYPAGGVVLFKRNVQSASQLRRLVADLHALGPGVPPLVAIDHEGGRVDRLRMRPFTHFPPASVVAASKSVSLAEAVGEAMGRELASIGIDVDFAPVLDVRSNPRNQVIGDRAYGTTPAGAARLALAVARGLRRGGVLPCGKHFPGHGGTIGDSHKVLPRVSASSRELARIELAPFVRAIRARLPALMAAHVVYPALDPKHPASLSPAICTTLLRTRLGFRGLLFSDDLEMQAITRRLAPERFAPAAFAAGCDMLLVCQSLEVARRAAAGLEKAVEDGTIPHARVIEAVGRIHAFRRSIPEREPAVRLGWPAHERLARRLVLAGA